MTEFEEMLFGPHVPELRVTQLPGAAEYFLGLKEKTAGVAGAVAPSSVKRAKDVPKNSAFAQAKAQARGNMIAAGGKPVDGAQKTAGATSGAFAAGAFAAGATAMAPTGVRGLLAKIPIERLRRAVGHPEAVARSKGEEYLAKWREGRDLRAALDPGGVVPALNKAIRNREGGITIGSLLKGLDDTGALPTATVVQGANNAVARARAAYARRQKMHRLKEGLLMAGAGAGAGGLGYMVYKRHKKNSGSQNA